MITRWIIDDWYMGSNTSFIQAQVTFVSGLSAFEMGRTYKELFDKIVDRVIDHAYLNQDVFGPANVLPDIDVEEVIGTDEEWLNKAEDCWIAERRDDTPNAGNHPEYDPDDHRDGERARLEDRPDTTHNIGGPSNLEAWLDEHEKTTDHRLVCSTVGEPGHWNCGWCDTHKSPRHECMCSVYNVQGHRISIGIKGNKSILANRPVVDRLDIGDIPVEIHTCPHASPRSTFEPVTIEDCRKCDDNGCEHYTGSMGRVTPDTLLLRG